MPIYPFKCWFCFYTEEAYLQISERDNIRLCPNCTLGMKRMLASGTNLVFKGNGWVRPKDYVKGDD